MTIQRFWELQEKRKNALTKTKLREEHIGRRVKSTETKAIAKIRKLRAVQDITIAKVAIEALSTIGSNSKRFLEHELQIGPAKHFRTREPDREVNSDGSFEDDEEVEILIEDSDNSSLANHAQNSNRDGVQTAKLSINEKLVKVGHGIAHYQIIFLPERGLYDEIKEQFSDQEWQALESSWSEVCVLVRIPLLVAEEKIIQQLPSIVNDNIESLLEEYAQATADATTGFHVRSSLLSEKATRFPTSSRESGRLICYQTPINVLHDASASEYEYRDLVINPLWRDVFFDVNHVIRMRTGEVENLDRKFQRNLSKFPNERRAIGWLHDAILVMKVASVDVQVGFGEVVGNACELNDGKMCEDRTKILKAMQLALVQLRRLLLEKGVDKSLLWKLETFGILVYNK
ncbi:hypothetical protein BC938DRAFT_476156 [Jimgerdemannia flammicorona]|uniref:Uncharacterized protein n=1 Tax=Jimgerdemannia flammicorona TaxID=994334 RepID=A0A433PJW4_9FUNG|nr:hypothetical protein BC938DRAFT_476156 [Jimgerdemannia flammicorona]